MKDTNRNARALSRTEKKRALDIVFTRLNNAGAEAGAPDKATPEQMRRIRELQMKHRNALNQFWAAGGDKGYKGKLITKEAGK